MKGLPMLSVVVLAISIILQFSAAILALRLTRITGSRRAWQLIALAVFLMGLRRSITFFRLVSADQSLPPDLLAELVALSISILMLLGIAWIAPIFHAIKNAEKKALRLSRVLEHSLNEIYTFDATNFRFIEVNRGARKNLKYTIEELVKLSPLDLKPELSAQSFEDLVAPLRSGKQETVTFITKHERKDGTQYPAEVHLQLLTDGKPFFAAIILDITERKKAEEKLKKANRLYATLSQINQAIVREQNKHTLFREICRIAVQYGKFKLAWIGLVEEKSNSVQAIAFSGEGSDYLQNIKISLADDIHGKGPTVRSIREDKSIVFNDLENNTDFAPWREQAIEQGYRSSAAFPLRLNHSVMGVLNIYAGETYFFDEIEIKLLEEVAGDISYALDKFEDEEKRKRAEEQIQTLSQAIEQSPVTVIIANTDAEIEYVNTAFEKVTGYRAAEVIGRNPRLLKSGNTPKSLYKELWQAITSGKPWQGELQNKKKNGELFWEHTHIAPVIDDAGHIRHYLAVKEDITLRKQQEEQLLHQAHFDALTNLPNRFLALDRLSQLLIEAQRNKSLVAVLFLDLDDFKKINDTLGHETGDRLLIEAAARLHSMARSGDTVGRLGGDEFIVLLGGISNAADTRPVVKNLLNQFRTPFTIDGRELILTVSVGIAVSPGDGNTASELLRNADAAMYHAKELGRNTYAYFTDAMNREVSRRLALEEQMYGALDRGEFTVFYQPKVDVSNGRMIGAEALLRWHNTALGDVAPVEFIAIAEQTGLIIPLGKFVLTEAMAMVERCHKAHGPGGRMAVNLSPRQFRDPELVSFIKKTIAQSCMLSECLELEITEGVLMSGHAYVGEVLAELSKLGVNIAMDDFGTGYSSLSYLRSYPFDILKIDSSFVRDISVDPADQALVNASISMAHGLNLKVVAEGVETEQQLAYLKKQGCDYAQGHLFGKAMTGDHLMEWMSNNARLS